MVNSYIQCNNSLSKAYYATASLILITCFILVSFSGIAGGVASSSIDSPPSSMEYESERGFFQQNNKTISAELRSVDHPSGQFQTGETASAQAVIENTGTGSNTFYVGMMINDARGGRWNEGNGKTVQLSAGEQSEVELSWRISEDAPSTAFDTDIAVWQEANPNNLENKLSNDQQSEAFEVIQEKYQVDVGANAPGSIRVEPPGTVTDSFSQEFEAGTEVSLTAEPEEGYEFVEWTGDVGSASETSRNIGVVVDQSREITAQFEETSTTMYQLSVDADTSGSIRVEPPGTVTDSFSQEFEAGTEVSLTAEPEEGYEFVEWTGDVGSASETSRNIGVVVDQSREITAQFEETSPAELEVAQLLPEKIDVVAGENIEFSATVSNPGDQQVTATLEYENELLTEPATEQEITLAPGEEDTINLGNTDTSEIKPGTYSHSINLAGAETEGQITISSSPKVAPQARIECGASNYTAGERVECSAEDSVDSDGYISSYQWETSDWEGSSDSGSRMSRIFDEAGEYTIKLTVTDNDGLTETVKKEINVKSRQVPPKAKINCSPTEISVDESTQCSAARSVDPNGYIDSYKWSFQQGAQTLQRPQVDPHTYENPGTYNVSLTVVDNEGNTDTATTVVEVNPANIPPETIIEASDNEIDIDETVELSASQSTGAESPIESYQWRVIEGDGPDKTGEQVTYEFQETGTYLIELVATDAEGITGSNTTEIEVTLPDIELAVNCNEDTTQVGEPVKCTANSSGGDGSSIDSYDWTYGSESVFGDQSATSRFNSPGTQSVSVRVTNQNGVTATAETTVQVNPRLEIRRIGQREIKDTKVGENEEFGVVVTSDQAFNGRAILSADGNVIESKPITGDRAVFNRQFQHPGERSMEIRVLGDGGQSQAVSWNVNVESLAPGISTVSPSSSNLGLDPGQTQGFSVQPENPSAGILDYSWSIDDSPSSSDSTLRHTFDEVGDHNIEVSVSRENSQSANYEWEVDVYPFDREIEVTGQSSAVEIAKEESTEVFSFEVENPESNRKTAQARIAASVPDGVDISGTKSVTRSSANSVTSLGVVEPGDQQSMRINLDIDKDTIRGSEVTIPYDVVFHPVDEEENAVSKESEITVELEGEDPQPVDDEAPLRGGFLSMLAISVFVFMLIKKGA